MELGLEHLSVPSLLAMGALAWRLRQFVTQEQLEKSERRLAEQHEKDKGVIHTRVDKLQETNSAGEKHLEEKIDRMADQLGAKIDRLQETVLTMAGRQQNPPPPPPQQRGNNDPIY